MLRSGLKLAAASAVVIGIIASTTSAKPPRDRAGRSVHNLRSTAVKKDPRPLLALFGEWFDQKNPTRTPKQPSPHGDSEARWHR